MSELRDDRREDSWRLHLLAWTRALLALRSAHPALGAEDDFFDGRAGARGRAQGPGLVLLRRSRDDRQRSGSTTTGGSSAATSPTRARTASRCWCSPTPAPTKPRSCCRAATGRRRTAACSTRPMSVPSRQPTTSRRQHRGARAALRPTLLRVGLGPDVGLRRPAARAPCRGPRSPRRARRPCRGRAPGRSSRRAAAPGAAGCLAFTVPRNQSRKCGAVSTTPPPRK